MTARPSPEELLGFFLQWASERSAEPAVDGAAPAGLPPEVLEHALEACRRLVAIENMARGRVERHPKSAEGSGPRGKHAATDPHGETRKEAPRDPAATIRLDPLPAELAREGARRPGPEPGTPQAEPPQPGAPTQADMSAVVAHLEIARGDVENLRNQLAAERARYEQAIRQNLRLADDNAELRHRVNALQQQVSRLYDKREMSRLLQRLERQPTADEAPPPPSEGAPPGPAEPQPDAEPAAPEQAPPPAS